MDGPRSGWWVGPPNLNRVDRKRAIPKGTLGCGCQKIQCMLGRPDNRPKRVPMKAISESHLPKHCISIHSFPVGGQNGEYAAYPSQKAEVVLSMLPVVSNLQER